MSAIVAIDPGTKGAWALIDPGLSLLVVRDLPIIRSGPKQKPHLDTPRLLDDLKDYEVHHTFIEEVHSSPQQGVVSAFTFGENFGGCVSTLAAICNRNPVTKVRPQTWKADLRVPADKAAAMRRANVLFPECHAELWPKKCQDGRAEAAMIALWGCLKIGVQFEQRLVPG